MCQAPVLCVWHFSLKLVSSLLYNVILSTQISEKSKQQWQDDPLLTPEKAPTVTTLFPCHITSALDCAAVKCNGNAQQGLSTKPHGTQARPAVWYESHAD